MHISASLTPRRVAAHAAIAIMVGSGAAAAVAFAGSGGAGPAPITRARPSIDSAARAALARLVAAGTIDRAQAGAIERQVAAGSIDPRALIHAGTVDRAQMRAVAGALGQVKRAAGRPAGSSPGAKVALSVRAKLRLSAVEKRKRAGVTRTRAMKERRKRAAVRP